MSQFILNISNVLVSKDTVMKDVLHRIFQVNKWPSFFYLKYGAFD